MPGLLLMSGRACRTVIHPSEGLLWFNLEDVLQNAISWGMKLHGVVVVTPFLWRKVP